VQRAAGERDAARQNGVMITDRVMPGMRSFLLTQRMVVVASRDAQERPWASIVFGRPGFISSYEDGQSATIDRSMAFVSDIDVLWNNLKPGAPLGMLAIDLSTRRRLRINGRVELLTAERLGLHVEQAYPNCPKYIQRRRLRTATPRQTMGLPPASEGHVPDAALLAAVKKSDTIFVASGHPSRGLDASHRGGAPGFIYNLAPNVLRIPDYAGNSMFNTLGNLRVDARCGLTLLDFQQSRLYQMTGVAILHLNLPAESDDPADTGRYWDFLVQDWRSTELPIQADWELVDYSPYYPSRLDRPSL
jgi:predicted pyridoxine 5'-phosphate oxidase superfamily flavin-nucleotide-binding protein